MAKIEDKISELIEEREEKAMQNEESKEQDIAEADKNGIKSRTKSMPW